MGSPIAPNFGGSYTIQFWTERNFAFNALIFEGIANGRNFVLVGNGYRFVPVSLTNPKLDWLIGRRGFALFSGYTYAEKGLNGGTVCVILAIRRTVLSCVGKCERVRRVLFI